MAVISDSVAGMTSAAPAPCTALPAMITSAEPAKPLTSAPAPNTAKPANNAPLRPNRSPSAPAVSNSPAKTSAYASTIHWSIAALTSSSLWSVGRATLSDDTAITIITSDRHMIPSRNQRRWWTAGWA